MIRACFDRSTCALTVSGHAGFDLPGKDPVCAAVSILVYTLAANAQELCRQGLAAQPVICLAPGDARVCCQPREGARALVTVVMEAVCAGLALMAREYPEHVAYRCVG